MLIFDSAPNETIKRTRSMTVTSHDEVVKVPRINHLSPSRMQLRATFELKALSVMKNLLQQPAISWASIGQQQAMLAMLEERTDIIVILPTGGGKTMLPLVSAKLDSSRTTIVIVPLRSLLQDYKHRLTKLRVEFEVFEASSQISKQIGTKANLILLLIDQARMPSWKATIGGLSGISAASFSLVAKPLRIMSIVRRAPT